VRDERCEVKNSPPISDLTSLYFMSRISNIFRNKKALIVFIMAGDPSLRATEKLVYEIEKAGADIIEIGIPFSDSIADGPTIQASALRALRNGTSAKDAIKLVRNIRKRSKLPLIFMTSFNILSAYGVDKFVKDSKAAGLDGLILPDLPVDVSNLIKQHGLDLIFLASPNSSDEHIRMIAKKSSGFIYAISVAGITGARTSLHMQAQKTISRLRKLTKTPIAIGFGIKTPEQARAAAKISDGVIVGSAVIDQISLKKNPSKLVSSLKQAVT
jgi:tryptophan synthase alpha chain